MLKQNQTRKEHLHVTKHTISNRVQTLEMEYGLAETMTRGLIWNKKQKKLSL